MHLSFAEKWILLGIPVIFLLGSLTHFLYEFSHQNIVVGMFSPINESVWEHTKLALLPTFIWWISYFLLRSSSHYIDTNSWFTASLVSFLTTLILVPLAFYFYTQAFGIESLWIDILLFFIAVTLGQCLGLLVYQLRFSIPLYWCICLWFLLFLTYAYLTFFPPKIPLFQDPVSKLYGIQR